MSTAPSIPARFQEVLKSIPLAKTHNLVKLVEVPAPQQIAPFALAIAATVTVDDSVTGRLVVLHEPGGNPAWDGDLRVVALVQATVETEVGSDDFWADVAWSWLTESLGPAAHFNLQGTVTKVVSRSFGADPEDDKVNVEMRLSWTPGSSDLSLHVSGWTEVLARFAGIPPLPEGVSALPGIPL